MAKDIWWANIVFREFSAHYIEKTDEEIVKDVRESLVRLAKLDTSGTSFGAFMVARAMERHGSVQAKASAENGKLGGRPRKSITEDGGSANIYGDAAASDGSEATTTFSDFSEARQSKGRAGTDSVRGTPCAPARSLAKNSRCPNSREDFHAFVADNNLHEGLAEEWYAIHEARGFVDENGNPIKNWRGALKNYCIKIEQKRRTA